MGTPTTKLGLFRPTYRDARWDIPNNSNFVTIDTISDGVPEKLKEILTSANIVKTFVYNTAKDSDGGKWTDTEISQSWAIETLNTATRGRKAQFPKVALIVAETTKITIYDATEIDFPMWMVIDGNLSGYALNCNATYPISGVSMINGLLVACSSGGNGVLSFFDFIKDVTAIRIPDTSRYYSRNIAERHTLITTVETGYYSAGIINYDCSDVTTCIIPIAPIDPLTGLQTPTTIVSTASGVSIIDGYAGVGTVVDNVYTSTPILKVSVNQERLWMMSQNSLLSAQLSSFLSDYSGSGSAWKTAMNGYVYYNSSVAVSSIPALILTTTNQAQAIKSLKALGGVRGLTLIDENPLSYADGMVAHKTKDYSTGWMKGDIRRAIFCETGGISDTLGTNIIANGDFANTSIWIKGSEWSISAGTANKIAGNAQNIQQNGILVVGRKYTITYTVLNYSTGAVYAYCGTTAGTARVANGTYTETLLCAGDTNFYLKANASFVGSVDNVYVKETVKDRSAKDSSLIINGTLSRSPVETGTDLQKVGVFSAVNNVSEPYSADLDFGTADFFAYGWINAYVTGATQAMFTRAAYSGSYSGSGIILDVSPLGLLRLYLTNNGFSTSDVVAAIQTIRANLWNFVVAQRKGTKIEMWLNSVKEAETTITNATGSLNNASATLLVGDYHSGGVSFQGYMSRLRVGAGSLSQAQIEKIYRDERKNYNPGQKSGLQSAYNEIKALSHNTDYDILSCGMQDGVTEINGLCAKLSTKFSTGQNIKSLSSDSLFSLCGSTAKVEIFKGVLLDQQGFETNKNKPQIKVFGDFINGHYSEFEQDGHLKFNGNATVFEDDNLDPLALTGTGTAPTAIAFNSSGISIASFVNAATDGVSSHREIPHCTKVGSKISFHCHWYPTTTNTGVCRFGLEYVITQEGIATPAATILYVEQAANGTAWAEHRATFADIVLPATFKAQIHFRFFRDGSHANDTFTGNAAVGTIGYHFEADGAGSRTIAAK